MEKYTGLEIAIIGLAGRFPKADNIEQYWENLKNGKDCISHFSDEEILAEGESEALLKNPRYVKANAFLTGKKYFDSDFFNYRPEEAELMDPQARVFHECCWEALEDSGYSNNLHKEKIGLFSTASPNANWETFSMLKNRNGLVDDFSASLLREVIYLSSRISYKFNFKGPSIFLNTACSSSLVTVHHAINSLLMGECTMALAGGVSINNYSRRGYLYQEGMINSKNGKCRPFDIESTGTLRGEGAGVVVLKKLKNALKDGDHIYAIVKGSGINNDGNNKVGYTAPSVDGQAEAIMRAMKMAQVHPDSISYIEAHGTATELGDPIEIEALNEAFSQLGSSKTKNCIIGSVKSSIGHLDCAAGIAGFIKTVLALKNKQVIGSAYFSQENPKINFANGPFYVNQATKTWLNDSGPLRAGVSSFGIGGTNAHVILEEAPAPTETSASRKTQLILVSGKTKKSLERNIHRITEYLNEKGTVNLPDIAYTLQQGRLHFKHKAMYVCCNTEDALITKPIDWQIEDKVTDSEIGLQNIVFMFSGQGSQYLNMCQELYINERLFREQVDECLHIVQQYSGEDFLPILFSTTQSPLQNNVNSTKYAQPLLFTIEYSLSSLLMSWGIQPDYMIGHSVGEYVAACLSGVFTLNDAIRLIVKRGELMNLAEEGSMLSIGIKEEQLLLIIAENPGVNIAAINSPVSLVVSGSYADIEKFEAQTVAQGYSSKKIHTSHAFHSYMMDGILADFEREFSLVNIAPPKIPYISNLTGEFVEYSEIKKASYWIRHLRHTVNFLKGTETLLKKGDGIFIEIGPGRSLCNYVRESKLITESHQVINMVRPAKQDVPDHQYLIKRLGQLWLNGITINWDNYYSDEKRCSVPLPTYSFEKRAYTADVDALKLITTTVPEKTLHTNDVKEYMHLPSWQQSISPGNAFEMYNNRYNFLVFSDQEGFSDGLIDKLMPDGHHIIVVKSGIAFKKITSHLFEIDFGAFDNFSRILKFLKQESIVLDHIIYSAALSISDGTVDTDGLDEKLKKGYLGLSYLAKAISEEGHNKNLNITVINNYLASITDEDEIDPLKATIQGPAKIIPSENASIQCKVIDIPFPFNNDEELSYYHSKVINEIFYPSEEPMVAYRFKQRWVQSFQPLTEHEKIKSAVKLLDDGVYIITGGLGAMGLTIALNLIRKFRAKVLIFHRSEFPERANWDNLIKDESVASPIKEKIMQIIEAEKDGGQMVFYQVDVSNENEVRESISEIKNKHSKINGLIWAAGEIDLGGIILKRNEFIHQLSSKVHGVLIFQKYLDFKSLDFLALFSSFGNVFYRSKFGQVGYNAANEFLESFSLYANKELGIRAFTVNWCDWLDIGMTVRTRIKETNFGDIKVINSQISDGIYPREGVTIFHKCLQSKAPVITVCRGNILENIKQHHLEYNQLKEELKKPVTQSEINLTENSNLVQQLTIIFTQFFGKKRIGVNDDFFELGGDSLRAMTLVARINYKLHSNLSIADLYKYPTIQSLSALLSDERLDGLTNGIAKAGHKSFYTLSSAQRRMYFLQNLDKESTVYNENQLLWAEGNLDKVKLQQAFEKLISRHEILRTKFIFDEGEPKQSISEQVIFNIEYFTYEENKLNETIQLFIRPFILSEAPLLRVGIIEKGLNEYLMMIDLHHIITDGVSRDILIKDFICLYEGIQLPELHLQYKDYCEWQQSDEQQKKVIAQKQFWLNEFEEIPNMLELPIDFERPIVNTHRGGTVDFEMGIDETTGLRRISENEGVSMFMVLLATFNILISKISNTEDIVVGSPTAGRPNAELENMVGMFVNMLPLRNYPNGELTFREFLADVKNNTLRCIDHQGYQYEELIEALKIERDMSRNPLFTVVFSHENFDLTTLEIPGLILKAHKEDLAISKFDLRLTTIDANDKVYCSFEYSTALFKRDTIERIISYLKQIVMEVIGNSNISLSAIEMLTEVERKQIVVGFNQTAHPYSKEKTIIDLFEDQVAKSPDNIAIISNYNQFNYQWLNDEANKMAHLLIRKKLTRGNSIVVIMERRVELIVALLAILKAGCKYVPIEPHLPANRVKTILNSVQAALIITNKDLVENINEWTEGLTTVESTIAVDTLTDKILEVKDVIDGKLYHIEHDELSIINLPKQNSSNDLAYVIFTSGSSGEPKGVAVEHQPVINLIEWVNKTYDITEKDKLLFVSSISFDLSVYDIFGSLAAGASVRIANRIELEDPELLAKIVIEEEITFWDSAPAMLQQVIPFLENYRAQAYKQEKFRLAFLSGDWIPLMMPAMMKELFRNLKFIALGGATEATVWSNFYEVTKIDKNWKSIPYGKPIQNAKYFILNKNGNICPIGIQGDLYIGGQCLAAGYINDKELSAKKFIRSPFDKNEIIYSTGDIARWYPDGNIEFLGRKDSQVKIRGYRIELGEIERKLIEFKGIEQLLIHVFEKNKFDKFICAYYVASTDLSSVEMTDFLNMDLPAYMIPKYFVRLEKIPITKNGKIDRKLLPAPQLPLSTDQITKAKTFIEEKLVEIWSKLLHLDNHQIGIQDDFFALGGHSIMAVHFINNLQKEFNTSIKLRDVFENTTIEKLSKLIAKAPKNHHHIILKAYEQDYYPTSHAQERLFYEQLVDKNSLAYNVSDAYKITGVLDHDKLIQSFKLLIERHESLRTSFLLHDGQVVQRKKAKVNFELSYIDKYTNVESAFNDFIKPFDLSSESLFRCALLVTEKNSYVLFIDIHHIVCDGISLNILMNDFKSIYLGIKLPALNLNYIDYALWQRTSTTVIAAQKQYWLGKMHGELVPLNLPVIQKRELVNISSATSRVLEIEGILLEEMKKFTSGSNVSDYMFLLSVYYILLSKMSGHSDVIIGADVMGRTHPDLHNIVGTFINLLPLRMKITPDMAFKEFLDEVKLCVLEAFENQDVQIDQIISMLISDNKLTGKLFNAHFSFANYFDNTVELTGTQISPLTLGRSETTQFELKLEVSERSNNLEIRFIFSKELYDDETIELFVNYYHNILKSVLKDSSINIDSLEVENTAESGTF